MMLSVYMPHGGYDEEVYSTALELVRILMEEERREEREGGVKTGDGWRVGWLGTRCPVRPFVLPGYPPSCHVV